MLAGLSLTLLPLKQNQVQRMLSAATWGSSFSTTSHLFFCLNLLPTMQTAPKRCEAECKECVHDALCMTQKFHEASTRCLQKFMKDLHYFLKSIFFMRCLKTIRILKKSITPTTDYCLARIMNIVKVLSSSKKVSIENSH